MPVYWPTPCIIQRRVNKPTLTLGLKSFGYNSRNRRATLNPMRKEAGGPISKCYHFVNFTPTLFLRLELTGEKI